VKVLARTVLVACVAALGLTGLEMRNSVSNAQGSVVAPEPQEPFAMEEPQIEESNRQEVARVDDASIGLSVEIFDSVTSDYVQARWQTCYKLSVVATHQSAKLADGDFEIEGCWDQQTVESGEAYLRYGADPGFALGIAAAGVERVRVGGNETDVQDSGVWYSRFEGGISQVDLIGSDGSISSLPLPGMD
jgi:hypothetical protein